MCHFTIATFYIARLLDQLVFLLHRGARFRTPTDVMGKLADLRFYDHTS